MKERPWLKWVLIVPGILFVVYIVFYFIRNRQDIWKRAHLRVMEKYPELDPEKHKDDYEKAKETYLQKVDAETQDIIDSDVSDLKRRFDPLFTRERPTES